MQLVLSGQKEHVLSVWIETVSAQRRKSETPQVSWKPLPLSVSAGRGGSRIADKTEIGCIDKF